MGLWAGDRVQADVRMSFRAGPADPVPDKRYFDEFIEANLRALPDGATELQFVNGWNGDGLDAADAEAVRRAWNEWLDRLVAALRTEADEGARQ